MLIDICLPIRNEELILEKNTLRLYNFCLEQNFPFDWQIIIINNGSTDHSLEIGNNLASNYQKILVKDVTIPGRGNALKKVWLESRADIVSYMDSDLAVDLVAFPKLLRAIITNEADLSIGCRLHPESIVKRSVGREIVSRSFNLLARKLLKHPHHDLQCGFKAIRQSAFINLAPYITKSGWFFDTELVSWASHKKFIVVEIPVNWEETRFYDRKSKVKLIKDSFDFIKDLYSLRQKLKRQ